MASSTVLVLLAFVAIAHGAYFITTPRQWSEHGQVQVCVHVPSPAASQGSLKVTLYNAESPEPVPVPLNSDRTEAPPLVNVSLVEATVNVPAGRQAVCQDIQVPDTDDKYRLSLNLKGEVGGATIDETREVRIKSSYNLTYIQTDKYLYQPGQKVQFRVLQVTGAKASVSTDAYQEIWVTTPSRNRIAQWKNVQTTSGLVHLEFTLADEPEEGSYTIHVKDASGRTNINRFKVEEYVLPRFEVTLTPPKYVLASNESFTFKVCAKYTFGQPLKGNMTLTLNNNQRKKCLAKITKTGPITGCKEFEITSAEMRVTDCNVYSVSANARVEEEGTGVVLGDTASVSISRNAVTFKTVYEDKYKKPFLPYTLKVRAELPDGSAASGVPVEVCAGGVCSNMTTASDGLFTAIVMSQDTNRIFMSTLNCRADMRSSSFSKELEHYYSPSNSSLVILAPEDDIKCTSGGATSHSLGVLFSATNQTWATINIQLVARGQVLDQIVQEVELRAGNLPVDSQHQVDSAPSLPQGTITGLLDIALELSHVTSPKVKVLVWYTRDDGEVVSDLRELKVEKCLAYNANLTWGVQQGQPGEETQLKVETEPNAVCSVGVVDKSTQLLSPKPDPITIEDILNYVADFEVGPWTLSQVNDYDYCEKKEREANYRDEASASDFVGFSPIPPPRRFGSYYSDYVDALKMFDESGLHVFTDFTVETRPCEQDENYSTFEEYDIQPFAGLPPVPISGVAFGAPSGGAAGGGVGSSADSLSKEAVEETAPRTDFPETWLWDLVFVPASGLSEQTVTLPDTITQWVGKAVCAHPEKGVGLSQQSSITTFTPFFTDLTLPPSVKRGEILPVKISVFNYLKEPLPVTVTLDESPEYEILPPQGQDAAATPGTVGACLAAEDKMVHTIRIKPTALGDVNLTVSAFVDETAAQDCGQQTKVVKRDVMIRPIKVEAEGFPREDTWNKYVCAEEVAAGEDTVEAWEVAHPANIVQDSARGWVTAVGDLLALSLENLGHLIRLPYGCGEQNMVNFAPNIYMYQYLNASQQMTPETKAKLLRFMRTGYQRELLYRRRNGSYSAFGSADDSGSTWLTAFVLKSFAQAQDIISVDREGLNQTRDWLEKNPRDKAGCIEPVGKLFHKGLKGGLAGKGSPVPLTAYILAAMLENRDEDISNSSMVQDALRCLTADTSLDPYTLALKSYALTLAKSPDAPEILQKLMDLGVMENNALYWKLPEGPYKSDALAVETAGYVLLTLLQADPKANILNARKIVKWITTQRNGRGGFYSTQDTVVGLQALAAYEAETYMGPLNVTATVSAGDLSKHEFHVTEDNKLLFQMYNLPSVPATVGVDVQGTGCAVMQAVLRYNIPDPEPSDAFSLSVVATNEPGKECITKRVKACASYLLPDGQSNMAVMEVNLISGFIPEKDDLKRAVRENRKVIKRYEVDGSKVSFYIEEFVKDKEVCVNFRMHREVVVENIKPGTVVVYDYYQPEFSFSQKYSFPVLDQCN